MKFTCCIGMSKGSNNELSHQQPYQSVPPKISDDASSPMPQSGTPHHANSIIISTTASALEDAICSRLAYQDAVGDVKSGDGDDLGEDEEMDDPVEIFMSDDANFLRCRPVHSDDGDEPPPTIFGISESTASLGGAPQDSKVSDRSISVHVTLLEPRCDHIICSGSNDEQKQQTKDCCCHHPRGNWTRQKGTCGNTHQQYAINGNAQSSIQACHANVNIVDLTKIQDLRRGIGTDELYPCFDTPGKVFHLLRSVLNCKSGRSTNHRSGGLHSASPWNEMYCYDKMTCNNDVLDGVDCAAEQVVALLVKDPNKKRENQRNDANDQFWNDIDQREVNELLNFRTGDAAPSYFLHSTAQLKGGNQFLLDLIKCSKEVSPIDRKETSDGSCSSSSSNALLFVYRHLPPRDVLSHHHLGHGKECEYVGCLRETYLEQAEKNELDTGLEPSIQTQPIVKHRMVSPPYQSHVQEYPGLLDFLLKRIMFIREEAHKIPQWTAWPEQNHYSDASWNVFPLCHTFPANDITQRKWIQKTCSFVPETTKLLRALGPALRTALFSRLDPRARLGTHTGWSDLSNHVLRLHIPLIVPGGESASSNKHKDDNYNTGLCGTWVDGCVETHEEGRVICFDDSKVHRAFNYSDAERIVLIVDLLRPIGLPIGTATGGHSDELDAFINGC